MPEEDVDILRSTAEPDNGAAGLLGAVVSGDLKQAKKAAKLNAA